MTTGTCRIAVMIGVRMHFGIARKQSLASSITPMLIVMRSWKIWKMMPSTIVAMKQPYAA